MKYRRIKAAAIAALFLIAGVLYSASRSQDIFLYDNGSEAGTDSTELSDRSESSMEEAGVFSEEVSAFSEEASIFSEEAQVHVHVCGAVEKAGVYLLSADSIVEDAIKAAGGVSEGGAADYLNLAGTVSEGDKIYVPFLEELEDPYGIASQASSGIGTQISESEIRSSEDGQSMLVNINTADKVQLMTLSGIGETRAEAIISYRETNGNFQQIEDIMKVSGIKEGAFEKIKDRITV